MAKTRLDEILRLRKVPALALAQRLGVTESIVSRWRSGKRTLPVDAARKIAPMLDVQWHELLEPPDQPLGGQRALDPMWLLAHRIAAVRWGYWGDDVKKATADLVTTPGQIREIEAGRLDPPAIFLMRLIHVTGITADFLFWGELVPSRSVPPGIAARIGMRFPDLLHPPGAGGSGATTGTVLEAAAA